MVCVGKFFADISQLQQYNFIDVRSSSMAAFFFNLGGSNMSRKLHPINASCTNGTVKKATITGRLEIAGRFTRAGRPDEMDSENKDGAITGYNILMFDSPEGVFNVVSDAKLVRGIEEGRNYQIECRRNVNSVPLTYIPLRLVAQPVEVATPAPAV
jgi:hypothetical protein